MKLNNEINNYINNKLENNINKDIEIKQDNFLETNLGKIINTAVDYGLKFILPDLFEDQIINIKNTILKDGLGDGINNTTPEPADSRDFGVIFFLKQIIVIE